METDNKRTQIIHREKLNDNINNGLDEWRAECEQLHRMAEEEKETDRLGRRIIRMIIVPVS